MVLREGGGIRHMQRWYVGKTRFGVSGTDFVNDLTGAVGGEEGVSPDEVQGPYNQRGSVKEEWL